ncbi:trypsin Inhibitor like cysteine rich domain protein [Ancylostoma caninum]|uniref:Trypsin Inhibitor like cysteine rich domain protein n=1 Tax=Ancylostoma caninum TaxID=29170 RepID=A0A368GZ85_ANCCA|nr:trypsin Inhibitor like cysteine rich domain protein [Ancylostoma caninum]
MSHFIWVLLFCVFTPAIAQYADEQPPIEENPCNLVDCMPNTRCIVANGQAKCIPLNGYGDKDCETPEPENPTCATVLCKPPTTCVLRPKKPGCRDDCALEAACVIPVRDQQDVAPKSRKVEQKECTFGKNSLVFPEFPPELSLQQNKNVQLMSSSTHVDPPASLRARIPSLRSAHCNVSLDVNASPDSSVMIRMSVSLSAAVSLAYFRTGTSQPQCKANEVFTDCGTACEPSCKNPKPEFCTEQCVVGCQCKPGFFRNDQNACVAKCNGGGAGSCGLNEERKQCGTACEPTCANPNPVCTRQCIIDVCQCKQGYIRDASNKCIPVEQCPKDRVIPCSEMNCPPGTVCELGRVICPFVPPCFTQQTKCVPLTPKETCATKKCPPGTVCEQETIFCFRAPCPQPKPECVKQR